MAMEKNKPTRETRSNNKIKVVDIFKKSATGKKADFFNRESNQFDQVSDKIFKTTREEKEAVKKSKKEKTAESEKSFKIKEEAEIIYKANESENEDEERIDSDDYVPGKKEEKNKKSWKRYFWAMVILALLVSFGYVVVKFFPKAEIKIITKKAAWNYEGLITANPKISGIDIANKQIPSAVFSQPKKNLTDSWLATGKKHVERKAGGNITIYNEFSSSPQVLVSGTRFQAPDGKIFKLNEKTIVPGVKVENGKIIASSISASVTADKAGEAYNIDPVSKFTIPKFKEDNLLEKYKNFYGSSQNAMSGGFVGEASYPTDDDIKKAKASAEEKIRTAIEGYLYTQIASENFKIIEGTKLFNILKEVTDKEADLSGNFSTYIEAEGSMQAFKESYVVDLMEQSAQQAIGSDFKLRDHKIDYKENIVNDPKSKLISMPIGFEGNFWKPVNADDFKNKILAKSENDLKIFIFSTPEIEKADISFWPFWVVNVPDNLKQVKVTVE